MVGGNASVGVPLGFSTHHVSRLRVLLVGVGCSIIPCSSDKRFIYDLSCSLSPSIHLTIWTLSDHSPGHYPLPSRPPDERLISELRLFHRATHDASEYRSHPAHGSLRNYFEIATSAWRASYGSLQRTIDAVTPDVIHVLDHMGPLTGRIKAFVPNIPVIQNKLTVATYGGIREILYHEMIHSALAPADRICTQTKAARSRLESQGWSEPEVEVLPWGVPTAEALSDETRWRIRARYGVSGDQILLVAPPRGNAADLTRLTHRLRRLAADLRGHIVVPIRPSLYDSMRQRLQLICPEILRLPTLTIERGPADFYRLLAAADLILADEGYSSSTSLLPLTWIEAMSYGTPVAVAWRSGVEDLIEDGNNGWIMRDEDAWKDHLGSILSPANLARVGEEARRTVAARFTINYAAQRYEQLWRKVVNSGKKPR